MDTKLGKVVSFHEVTWEFAEVTSSLSQDFTGLGRMVT